MATLGCLHNIRNLLAFSPFTAFIPFTKEAGPVLSGRQASVSFDPVMFVRRCAVPFHLIQLCSRPV